MTKFGSLKNLFSHRNSDLIPKENLLSEKTRNRIFFLLRENSANVFSPKGDLYISILQGAHWDLLKFYGELALSPGTFRQTADPIQDLLQFLQFCTDAQFLDFLELIFKQKHFSMIQIPVNSFINEVNDIFDIEQVPYELTKQASRSVSIETTSDDSLELPFLHNPINTYEIIYPQVILRGDKYTDSQAMQPALTLLADPRFQTANSEFLQAHQAHREKREKTCIDMCYTAFESTLKTICKIRNWKYKDSAQAGQLIKTVCSQLGLPDLTKNALNIVASLRNQLGNAHGDGIEVKPVDSEMAQYALNITASAIVLLVEKTIK